MYALLTTSPKHYLTGQAALNVPSESGDFADWHFTEVFLSGRGKLQVAGRDFPDTSDLLGSYGVRECAEVLRRYGVAIKAQQKVYAANHVRAALDLVLAGVVRGRVPNHITLADTIDTFEGLSAFREQMAIAKSHLASNASLALLEQWEAQQS